MDGFRRERSVLLWGGNGFAGWLVVLEIDTMNVNFGLTANDYAKYRAGFPDAFFDRVFAEGYVKAGASLLDLGTGTGTLARGFALRGCRVIGIDPSAQMMEQAKELDQQVNAIIEYRVARAEETGVPSSSIDVVTAGQCWHWFDRPNAAQEVKRILKPNGAIIIAHFDWIPITANVVDFTEQLIQKHNPSWTYGGGTGIYPQWLRDLGEAGFANIRTFSFDVDVPYTSEAWRGRIRASAGVGATLSPEQVERFDSELKQLLEEQIQARAGSEADVVLQVPHRVFTVTARKLS
jgi:SAM-dependent methyltransferase